MQIEIDFDVFKSLTALRRSEGDSYNTVLRRLLQLPDQTANALASKNALLAMVEQQANALSQIVTTGGRPPRANQPNSLANALGGVWFGNTHFPDGTQFRATYKGRTYTAQVRNGQWVDASGVARTSPSEAASAISGTNVNGWRFWFAKRPGDSEWYRLDAFKQ